METALAELKERLAKLTDVRRTEGLLVWDMTVFMPPGGPRPVPRSSARSRRSPTSD